MDSRSLSRHVDGLWTTQDLIKRFKVTAMTIRQWRTDKKLPAIVLEGTARPTIRFVPKEVIAWAKKHDKAIVN